MFIRTLYRVTKLGPTLADISKELADTIISIMWKRWKARNNDVKTQNQATPYLITLLESAMACYYSWSIQSY